MTSDIVLRSTDVPASFTQQMEMARVLAESSLLPDHLRRQPANVLVILMGARALDVPAFWALQSMHVIKGKLTQAAELMRALVIRAGHRISVVERSRTRAVVEIQRSDKDKPYRSAFTWDDAVTAKLVDKDSYQQYPQAMLVARATAIAVRDECPDVLFGIIYTPDEMGAVTDADGAPIDPSKVVDGEVVEAATDEEVNTWAEALAVSGPEELPVVWAEIVGRAAQDRKPPGRDDTLTDTLAMRIGLDSLDCTLPDELRELWKLASVCKVLAVPITAGQQKVPLGDYLTRKAQELMNPPAPAAEDIDTDNARELREAAAASWDEKSLEGEIVE